MKQGVSYIRNTPDNLRLIEHLDDVSGRCINCHHTLDEKAVRLGKYESSLGWHNCMSVEASLCCKCYKDEVDYINAKVKLRNNQLEIDEARKLTRLIKDNTC